MADPREPGGTPSYTLVPAAEGPVGYAVPAAGAVLHVRRLVPGERTAVPDAPWVYAHVVRGAVRLAGAELGPGDAARITGAEGLEALATAPAELLLWEMTP